MPNAKIAIIGPVEITQGFKSLGVSVFDARNSLEAREKILELKKSSSSATPESFAIIIVIEDLLKDLPSEEKERLLSNDSVAAIIPIPGTKDAEDTGVLKLKQLAAKAIGMNIF